MQRSDFFNCCNTFQITNTVVTNQSANATLALGASPIMASASEEMEDLSRVIEALLVNLGTVTDKAGMLLAGQFHITPLRSEKRMIRICTRSKATMLTCIENQSFLTL
jgi:hypothetical protein